MSNKKDFVHPYIPNSVPEVKKEMLKSIGVKDIEELYSEIPEFLRFKGKMDLPEPYLSEFRLKQHVEQILKKNQSCVENISFLGGGCWQHYVPAICDEVNSRSEFLTAYAGEAYEDHGRFQTLFEYESLMGELLDMDVVNVPTYDWSQAAATSIRMAGRITERHEILISDTVAPDRLAMIKNYCQPVMEITMVKHIPETGLLDLNDFKGKINKNTAGLYFENPSYLGFIENEGQEISDLIHKEGGLVITGIDPSSLGILIPPSNYGADIVCGDIQGLGMHLSYGGGLAGFIASCDDEKYVMEYPSRLFGITKTSVKGEYGFGDVTYDRTSFGEREKGKEFVGTHSALWGITAGVYLSLMGPKGMYELGETIIHKARYAQLRLNKIPGIKAPAFNSSHFKEFVVDFNQTGKKVANINSVLRENKIFGGKDISGEFPELGQSSLYCVTEIITKEDIDYLIDTLERIVARGRS